MVSAPTAGGSAANGTGSGNASSRGSPAVGSSNTASAKSKAAQVNSNGYHPTNPQVPLSSMRSTPLELTSVERRGQPTATKEPAKKKSRPHGLEDAPTYCPTEEEWKDPMEYIKKISPEARNYGLCKIIPPDSWNPEFAIDTERFHFRTRKQELNSVEGSTRANISYLDALAKFHKQQGSNLHRLPYVDKKPLDLYRLKKAVEARGGFDKVCKLKKWAEIGRDLGYSGKIMSSLSTSLKNSYQRWLCPYEEYLRLAKPGVHQQLEFENGGPYTPSPAVTPMKRSNVNTPSSARGDSPARHASDALQASINGLKKEADRDTPMADAPPTPAPAPAPVTSGFKAINTGGFTAVNSGFKSVNRPAPQVQQDDVASTPPPKSFSPVNSAKNTPDYRPSNLGPAALKRQISCESLDLAKKDSGTDKDDGDAGNSRRSKRLKKDTVPTVAGSHMSLFRPSVPRIPRDEALAPGEKCEQCGKAEEAGALFVCESCDHAYHGTCLDPPPKHKPDSEWNCPRCLVGDGQYGFEEGGLYSLKQFQQKAADFKQGYFEKKMPFDPVLNCHRPVTEEDVETEFWRLVADIEETVEVEYGADIHCTTHGSGFPTVERHPNNPYSTDPWNLNLLPLHPESLFRHIKSDISGMTVPWVYVGMIFSTFCWHNEDHYAYSANYQHFGATKTWYGIPGEDAEKFEAAMREAVPELFETQPDLLFQLVTLLTPEQLKKAGVRVYALDQRAGQFVITFPQAYHAGFNHGFNFNEAVNFAPCDWEPFGLGGVERLQVFRRQPCFSHDELLWTAAEGTTNSGLTIQTAKWLAPALERIKKRELAHRTEFVAKHLEPQLHDCALAGKEDDSCPLKFEIDDTDVPEEEYQCSYCKAFTYLSRFKCLKSGKILCLAHAGYQPCCESTEHQRFHGEGHAVIYRQSEEDIESTYGKVLEKARTPEAWEEKYEKLLEEEATPSLKTLRNLLHEGEKIPHDLPSLPLLREFVDRCNEWVEEATNYTIRKQQNRRKSEKSIHNRKNSLDQKDRDARHVSNVYRLIHEAEQIGFDCPEITQLRERVEAIEAFRKNAAKALEQIHLAELSEIEDLLEEGRAFNVDTPEVDRLSRVLEQLKWGEKARNNRSSLMSLNEVRELIEEGKRLDIAPYNDHLVYYIEQMTAGQQWEKKARELIIAEVIHYPQLEALSVQVQANFLPVTAETLNAVDQILYKQREAHRQIVDLTERSRDPDIRNRPKYAEVAEIMRRLDELNSKPNGTLDLEREQKRHEDWMREGKKLFGKTNAPLHILKSHMDYVLERNQDCFDIVNDKPRMPAEPASREASPDQKVHRWEDPRFREVFCICRKVEAGMMIECELCHEWYHGKCLKIARGKVKDEDKYTCPICDWRVKIPRDAARPKIEELIAWSDKIPSLPFQPEEEEVLTKIIDNAQDFRNHITGYCNPVVSTESEADTQRFYLRKIEGAEILLAYETNFFRQELHKWCPVAPMAPPVLEVSKSTRKPRPTKLQKLLAQFGVDDAEDLPENMKAKAASLKRKAQNAEAAAVAAAAAAATSASGATVLPPGLQHGHSRKSEQSSATPPSTSHGNMGRQSIGSNHDPMDIDSGPTLHPGLFMSNGAPGPQLVVGNSSMSLEERLLRGEEDGLNLHTEAGKKEALTILGRTDEGRKRAVEMFGPDVFKGDVGILNGRDVAPHSQEDVRAVNKMFDDLTNQDDDDFKRKQETFDGPITAESLESERNGMDALLDGD
ncbi:PLU-1-like protein [Colletotrichum godetiae]|uniref:PLU-1-like protein n=1 Tax=Colletotrichum godetiae TaxID=1209918 RepID=A0AAJ0ENW2_9PEZI|nr:PLU-1-like protein [Colletotrichum godetiae]KAK1671016.1 PLU-1-like protein [Colletotrichum godetiae]